MNPSKCAFFVTAGNFLKFLVHNWGVEIDKKKSRAIKALKKQKGVAALDRTDQFPQLQLFRENPVPYCSRQQRMKSFFRPTPVLQRIKNDLSEAPVLIPPRPGEPLRLYISSALNESLGAFWSQKNRDGNEQARSYLSRVLQGPEKNYSPVEKMCLCLYFAAVKVTRLCQGRRSSSLAQHKSSLAAFL